MKTLILRGPGTNCDQETAYAFQLAGSETEIVHLNQWLQQPELLRDFQVLCLPGGFSFGDDLGAGRVFGYQLEQRLGERLRRFHDDGKLILGICNGFQILLSCGLLVAPQADGVRRATLAANDCGHFLNRWVYLSTASSRCVFLRGIRRMVMPMAHAEGKFLTDSTATTAQLIEQDQIALRYVAPAAHEPSLGDWPANPNGSLQDIAGLCDPSGRILGLMPHPERHITRTQHFQWTRWQDAAVSSDNTADFAENGLGVFRNAVEYFR
jgi:phosphoribosylformylglycinamidine synthase subunit PurQ / glutaminase